MLTPVYSRFTSYVSLLDNLIDTADDVLVLEASDIVESKLCREEEVARFINSLGKGRYLNFENHKLAGLFKQVKEYAAEESNQWRARLVHQYFDNPWLTYDGLPTNYLLASALAMVMEFVCSRLQW